jgi:hypothetical protein
MLKRWIMAMVIGLAAVTVPATPAAAGGGTAPYIPCDQGGCDITVGGPGKRGSSSGGGGGGGSKEPDPCVYELVTPSPAVVANLGGQPPGPGAWYFRTCYSLVDGTTNGLGRIMWLTSPPPAISPALLAQIARARMNLPAVSVTLNPRTSTLVSVPVWLTVSGGWRTVSARASVPGVSVTATATPKRVVWTMGDGSSVTCNGPGTVYRPGTDNPNAASPTCGFTYRRASGSGAFRVTATVTYAVTWAGGGQTGSLGDLTAAGVTTLRVNESQAIVTN